MFNSKYFKYKRKYLELKNQTGGYNIDDLILKIKNEVKEEFTDYKFDLAKINQEIDIKTDLKAIMLPLYYLFDKNINNDIGSTYINRDIILSVLDINTLLDICKNNIININTASHTTLFYIFEYKECTYFYYSNSGFGIDNHVMKDKYVFPKLFRIIDNNFKIKDKLIGINQIINIININIIKNNKNIDEITKIIDNILILMKTILLIDINADILKDNLHKIFEYIQKNNIKSNNEYYQTIVYTLLYYLASVFQNDIKECTFNDIINDSEPSQLFKQYLNDNIFSLFLNSIGSKNKIISNNIIYNLQNNINPDFKNYINQINNKLFDISDNFSTLKYMFDRLIINYDDKMGLCNLIQSSGSCTFYSYYLLATNIFLLNGFNKNYINRNYMNGIIKLHYKIIYFFGVCNNYELNNFTVNNYINHSFIYNLCDEYNLTDEIVNFYNVDKFILKNKIRSDFLLNYKIEKSINSENIDYVILNKEFILYFKKGISDILNDIRKNKNITKETIKENIDDISRNTIIKLYEKNQHIEPPILNNITNYLNDYSKLYYYYFLIIKYNYNNLMIIQNKPIIKQILYFVNNTTERDKAQNRLIDYTINKTVYQHYTNIDLDIFIHLLNNEELSSFCYIMNMHTIDELEIFINESFDSKFLYIKLAELIFLNVSTNIININDNEDIYKIIDIYEKNVSIDMSKFINYTDNKKIYQYLYNKFYKHNNIIYNLLRKNAKNINRDILSKLLNILTDSKYIFINNNIYHELLNTGNIYYLLFIKDESEIIMINDYVKFMVSIIDIIKDYQTNDERWTNGSLFTSLTNNFINYDKFEWVKKLNNVNNVFINFYLLKINNIFYKKYKLNKNDDSIIKIIGRFGLSYNNICDFMIFFNTDNTKMIIITTENLTFLPSKCILLNINHNYIDKNEIYMINEYNEKYKLLFDIDFNKLPFILFIPKDSLFLCYEKNSTYYLELIINLDFISYVNNKYKIMFNKDWNPDNLKYNFIETYIISPSLTLPISKTFDKEKYNDILNYYNSKNIIISENSYSDELKKNYKSDNLILQNLNFICKDLKKEIKKMIEINNYNFESCKDIIVQKHNKVEKNIISNFKEQYRFCKLGINKTFYYSSCYKTRISNILAEIELEFNSNFKLFVIRNLDKLCLIMICNILQKILKDLADDHVICEEIQPILLSLKSIEYFLVDINQSKYYIYELIFLLQFEYFLNKNQLEKYREIRDDINNDELKLHQFMMGKGKTSVFTPLLSYSIQLLHNKQPTIITASHLVNDTKKIVSLNAFLNDISVNVFSDFEAKKRWITEKDKINFNNEYNIIDEFDSHHNYLQSIFNYVKNELKCIEEDEFNKIFDYIYNKNKEPIENRDNTIIGNLGDISKYLNFYYLKSEKMIYNIRYGFDNENKNVICIPFLRKDTPIKNSNFSSLLLKLILTFKTYISNFDLKLQNSDYERIHNNISYMYILQNICGDLDNYIRRIQDDENEFTLENIKLIFTNIYELGNSPDNLKIKYKIIKKYLYNINSEILVYTTNQLNISFQDIIYNNYKQWQVGYTGTTSLTLNEYDINDKHVFREIIPDYDEKIEVLLALRSTVNSNPNSVCKINTSSITNYYGLLQILSKLFTFIKDNIYKGEPRGIVDLCGIFKDQDNYKIANILSTFFNTRLLKNKKIIYFKENTPYQIYESKNEKFDEKISNDNFYYYDQAHTVGSDLKQPQTGHVIVIINEKTRYTDFAQGIFRFRKLNKGTYLSVIIDTTSEKTYTVEDIENILNDNETKFNDNQKDGLKFQLLKAMIRNKYTKNYFEDDLMPDFLRENINQKLIEEILKNNIIREYDNSDVFINNLIKYFKENHHKTQKLIFGYANNELTQLVSDESFDIQANAEANAEAEAETEAEAEAEAEASAETQLILNTSSLFKLRISSNSLIYHQNCSYCKNVTCTKLFITNTQIKEKDIYISYNLLNYNSGIFTDLYNSAENLLLLNYVEFDDYFLIEKENICTLYYNNLLPVYNLYGKLKNNILYNRTDTDTLVLPPLIIKIFGIKNKLPQGYSKILVEDEIEELTINGKILLSVYFSIYFKNLVIRGNTIDSTFIYHRIYSSSIYRLSPLFVTVIKNIISKINDPNLENNYFEKISLIIDEKHNDSNLLFMYNGTRKFFISDPDNIINLCKLKYNDPDEKLLNLIKE